MKYKLWMPLVVLTTVFAGPASATRITFDEPYSPISGIGGSFTTQGFLFDLGDENAAFVIEGGSADCGPACPYNRTNYLFSQDSGRFLALTMSALSGESFSLFAFDAAESFIGLDFEAAQIDIIGTRGDGSTISRSFLLDGINDGDGSSRDFQTFGWGGSFRNLVSVSFNGSGGRFSGPDFFRNDFSLDNLVIVPEPSTFFLLGLGLVGMSAIRLSRIG